MKSIFTIAAVLSLALSPALLAGGGHCTGCSGHDKEAATSGTNSNTSTTSSDSAKKAHEKKEEAPKK